MSEKTCEGCQDSTDFYTDEKGKERCSLCEHAVEAELDDSPLNHLIGPVVESAKEEAWDAKVPPDGKELIDELDHIRLDLQGDFRNADLKGLLDEFKEIEAAMAETGRPLKLVITAIRKSKIQKLRDAGGIVIPFRDRHGRPIPGRALHLPFNKNGGKN